MIKVIIPGKKRHMGKKFQCRECGCEFVADSTEYLRQPSDDYFLAVVYMCKCPCCGNKTYTGVYEEVDMDAL